MVKIRDIEIGNGIPKICVPIVEKTEAEILAMAEEIVKVGADIVEWRGDWYQDIMSWDAVNGTAKKLRKILGNIPLLFTFRREAEGGEKEIEPQLYCELIQKIAATGFVDLVDIELFTGDKMVCDIIDKVHQNGVKVIVSNHDFHQTPEVEEIVLRLVKMRELGADIPKIAVMPNVKKDVLTLLTATEMASAALNCPVITMSMGSAGAISRLAGEVFGSALTFGTVGKSSAPGQIEVGDLRTVLNIIHKQL